MAPPPTGTSTSAPRTLPNGTHPLAQATSASGDRAAKYRGATVEDLDPPAALSVHPSTSISAAYLSAFERDYSHLTVTHPTNRALLGYLSISHLKRLLETKAVADSDPVEKAMQRFRRRSSPYKLITLATPLEELEAFFDGEGPQGPQDFAVVTDNGRRFVLGVATKWDLEEFVRRRPA